MDVSISERVSNLSRPRPEPIPNLSWTPNAEHDLCALRLNYLVNGVSYTLLLSVLWPAANKATTTCNKQFHFLGVYDLIPEREANKQIYSLERVSVPLDLQTQ